MIAVRAEHSVMVDLIGPDQFEVKHKVFGKPCVLKVKSISYSCDAFPDRIDLPTHALLWGEYEREDGTKGFTNKQVRFNRIPKRVRKFIPDLYRGENRDGVIPDPLPQANPDA